MKFNHSSILGLGSNIHPKSFNLSVAANYLSEFVKIEKISGIYKTKSLLLDDQPDYFNIVLICTTFMTLHQLIYFCQQIEKKMDREKQYKWGPRNIDIDILDFDGQCFSDEIITVPHKFLADRNFVIYPLKEICPHYVHPRLNIGIEKMEKLLNNHSYIIRVGDLLWPL